MKSDITEFSYGYAVTEAFTKRWRPGLTAAPVFPSLIEEGRPGGGYDVKIERRGVPFFLQFKLSEYMVRSTASEVQQGLLALPFYRMPLRPSRHSDQHQLLCDLESAGNLVHYVAPMFHRVSEFNEAYLAGQVLQRSIFVRPSAIGPLPDGNDHHIAFQNRKVWWRLSEPRRGDTPLDEETFDADVRLAISERGTAALTEGALQGLKARMVDVVNRRRHERQRVRRSQMRDELLLSQLLTQLLVRPDPLRDVAYLARTFFGCECLTVWMTGNA